ncbi:response regulator transcription factor [Streptomyces coeruleoprunus]|uniref:Sensory transduction protein RegX3 n=1 Tax=Streptomyces coeruleoprunus TaxID=285563 RepID=A0ABV9XFZ0_9ACTN
MRILLVEDDEHVADALADVLRQHGHDVTGTATGARAVDLAADADFVLLDLNLPDLDGYEVCRRIRAVSTVPIIAVTARSEEIDRVMLLQAGADDYVVKPYGIRELLARIEAVQRRTNRATSAVPPAVPPVTDTKSAVIEVGALAIDVRARRVTLDGRPLTLTAKEFDLLAMLAGDCGAVLTRESIIERVWDENWFGSTRTLDVHVGALRTKLGDKRWIETVRGVGFRLTEPAD